MRKAYDKAIPYLILGLLVGAATAVTEGFLNIYIKEIIDVVFYNEAEGFQGKAVTILLLSVGVLILNTILSAAKGYYRKDANLRMKKYYLLKVFDKNINEFNKESNARYVSNMTNDLNTIDTNFVDAIFDLSLAIISFFVFAIIIAGVNTTILLMIIGLTILLGGLSSLLSKPLKRYFGERSKLYEGYTTYINEVLNAFRIVRTNNLHDKITTDFGKRSSTLQDKSFQIDKYSTFIYAFQNGTMNLLFISIVVMAIWLTFTGEVTLGGVILIISNAERMIRPLQQAAELFPKIISTKSIFKAIDEVLRNKEDFVETEEIDGFHDSIEIRNASFSYDENEIFSGVNLTFEKGKKYLVVGPSGGGKSTMLKLLRKYFYVDKGDILLDGIRLKDIRKDSYFRHIANVEQKIFIFDDTLKNNLTLYRDTDDERIEAAIEGSGLRSFVDNLDKGLDTVLEDNGRNISGGEKSRIAIARALLSKTDILFLDEAFASLDYSIARDIERTILNIDDLTVINVSHVVIEENSHLYDDIYHVAGKRAVSRLEAV